MRVGVFASKEDKAVIVVGISSQDLGRLKQGTILGCPTEDPEIGSVALFYKETDAECAKGIDILLDPDDRCDEELDS